MDQGFRNHPRNKAKARKADKKIKTIAGILVKELERNLPPDSMHEPDVLCISKGKEHKKYEFGNKVSIVKTQNTGVIVGAMGFRNEFDGHTLVPALEQVA